MCNACIYSIVVFSFIRRVLQYDVDITNKNYIYVAIWTILTTFYHVERMFPKQWGGVTIQDYLLRQINVLVCIIFQSVSIYLEYNNIQF